MLSLAGVATADTGHPAAGGEAPLPNLGLHLLEGAHDVHLLALEALRRLLGPLLEEHQGLAVVA
jgi:hypothetical protein